MSKIAVLLALSAILAGCAASDTAFRGAPPEGMTRAEYTCQLTGRECPIETRALKGRAAGDLSN